VFRTRATNPWRRLRQAILLLAVVVAVGTAGYTILGLDPLDALYQTVTTVSTVGFRELGDTDTAWKIFTVVLILVGVGLTLYTFGVLVDAIVDGRVTELFGRRRMERQLAELNQHVIVCGWGRVGRTLAAHLEGAGMPVVVIERDEDRIEDVPQLAVEGDATDEEVLRQAGLERARALVASLTSDADNLYVTLTARALRPDLFIVARARSDAVEARLVQAGADRVVNPQQIGGARMAAMIAQPHVADFLDVVMHDGRLEFRLAEVTVPRGSPLVGSSIRDAHIRDQTGALVLALRDPSGEFTTNPPPDTVIEAGHVLIAIGTLVQLAGLSELARGRGRPASVDDPAALS
jgi:voltage-gated potassium channel